MQMADNPNQFFEERLRFLDTFVNASQVPEEPGGIVGCFLIFLIWSFFPLSVSTQGRYFSRIGFKGWKDNKLSRKKRHVLLKRTYRRSEHSVQSEEFILVV